MITSTSYVECDTIPLLELFDFYEKAVKMWNKMHDTKGGSK